MIAACLGVFAALVLPRDGHAQTYPDRAINYIVPSSPGSSPDIVGRIMAEALAKILGQPVVVLNRAGAGGTIAAAAAAKATPDGYTILQANTNHSFSQTFYKNLGYDLEKDFSPVGRFASAFYIVLAHPKLGVKTLKELIDKAKAEPGKLNYASGGVGAATFIVTEVLKAQAGIDMVHVPYNGGGPALASILAGVTEIYGSPYATAKPFVDDGKLVGLAVTSAAADPLSPGHADGRRNAAGLRGDDVVRADASRRHAAVRFATSCERPSRRRSARPETRKRLRGTRLCDDRRTRRRSSPNSCTRTSTKMAKLIKQYNLKPE